MATKKISELEEINQAENDDYLVVVDTSESKNKKITKENFLKISALEEKISDLENNQLTASTEGTSIDINDSADYQVREMIPNGNVIQNSTTGKNKFAGADTTVNNGITFKKNSDGSYNITGSATAQANAYNYVDINNSGLVNGQTYTFWASQVLPAEFFVLIEAYNGTTWQRHAMNGLKDVNQSESQVINLTDTTRIRFALRVSEGTTINISNLKIQLESGSTATNFEKYTGGIASPNPQYEQPINSAGDNINLFDKTANITRGYTYTSTGGTTQLNNCFVQEKYIEVESSKEYILSTTNSYISETDYRLVICEYDSSKNFIKRNLSSTQYYKITTSATTKYVRLCASTVTIDELKFEHGSIATPYSPYGMGSINEVISNKNLFKNEYILAPSDNKNAYLEAGTYTLATCDNANFGTNVYIKLFNKNGAVITTNGHLVGINTAMNFSTSSYNYYAGAATNYITFTIDNDYQLAIGLLDADGTRRVMLVKGNTIDRNYVPHQEQNISIPCQQPMRSIGNVRDSFVKIDGVWYEKHNIGQVVLNGSRDWVKSSTYSNEKYFCGYLAYGISNSIVGSFTINDSFQIGYYVDVLDEECMSSMPQLHVRILASRLTENSVNAFKTWLSTHNTEVIYQLAEPIYLECTEEQITALEKARTYKPVTHISSADVVPAYLEVTYVRDLETVINNLS